MKTFRLPLLLAVITVSALAPFLHKAFDIDDPLFLWMAQQITKHPLNPYGFEVNWSSMAQPMWLPMQNPPLCSYYIAVVASVVGWNEVGLHAAFMLPAIAVVLGTFAIAQRLCGKPATAALLTLFTPVFLISASNVMCDVMLLAFWIWSIELWLVGLDRAKWWLFASSAAFATAATLTKYFGVSLIPLLLAYTLARERRARPALAYLLIPLIALLAYEEITKAEYGHGLFSNAMMYLRDVATTVTIPISTKLLTGFSFVGGCLFGVLLFAPVRSARWLFGGMAVFLVTSALFWFFMPAAGEFGTNSVAVRLESGVFAALGVAILLLPLADFCKRRDADSLLLLLWVTGTFVFATFLNWSITARTILPMAPAVTILVMRCFDRSATILPNTLAKQWRIACAAMLSLILAYADYRQAGTSREAARYFEKRFGNTRATVWFQSHWGFQWYMQQWGAKPITAIAESRSGDFMIIPSNNADPLPISRDTVVPVQQIRLRTMPFVSTFAPGTGAGFYSSVRGPVPWIVAGVPEQRCEAVMYR